MNHIPPSARKTAFNCPHCGAFAQQYWYSAHAQRLRKDVLPNIINAAMLEEHNFADIKDREWATKKASGRPFIWDRVRSDTFQVDNIWFSDCFNCDEIALWLCDALIYPQKGEAPLANPDMPEGIRRDYDEASVIMNQSPRGAAALLRLAIQKLCKELGQPGKNLNEDIAALVKDGLDPLVQKSMDIVRVIGNKAVHPGQIDLHDDRETAETLFKLLNLVVDEKISKPKNIDKVYASLPEGAVKAIEKRDGQK